MRRHRSTKRRFNLIALVVIIMSFFVSESFSQALLELEGVSPDPRINFINQDTFSMGYAGPGNWYIEENEEDRIGFFNSAEWGPINNNTMTLGSSDFRWSEIWSTNGLNMASDRRLKKNITDLHYGLSEIKNLRPVCFEWKDGKSGTRLGFIAQEMENIVPDIVQHHTMSQEDIDRARKQGRSGFEVDSYTINYISLIPILVNSISELADENENLRKRVSELEAKSQ